MSDPARILIVDDEPNVRLVFRPALESAGYAPAATADGPAAPDELKRACADLVLLDLQMPGLDGIETLRRLRESGDNVPVVIVTTYGSVPDAAQGRGGPNPSCVTPSGSLAHAKRALNRRAFREAEVDLREAIEQDARCAEGHYLLGVIHEMRDDRHAAYTAYLAALRADPTFEPARLHMMQYFTDRLL